MPTCGPAFQRPYKHRLPEGAMSCVDCHNPHGSALPRSDPDHARQRARLRQMPRRQGGAVHLRARSRAPRRLHACHQPHGSANPRMLTRHEVRFVCMECHSNLPVPVPRPPPWARWVRRSTICAVRGSKTAPLPPEGAWLLCESGTSQMRYLLAFLILMFRPFAQAAGAAGQAPREGPGHAGSPGGSSRGSPRQGGRPGQARRSRGEEDRIRRSPAPGRREWLTGSVDFGYRWVGDVRQPSHLPQHRQSGRRAQAHRPGFHHHRSQDRLFDRLDARANAWGGDPTIRPTSMRASAACTICSGDYRNIAYFNALPSFANPLAPARVRRAGLRHAPAQRLSISSSSPASTSCPYLVFERNSGYGHGMETWVQDSNDEFAVPMLLRDSTNNYRGGFRWSTIAGTSRSKRAAPPIKDDDQASPTATNYGDRTTPLLGQTPGPEHPAADLRHPRQQHLQQGSGHGQSHFRGSSQRPVPVQRAEDRRALLRHRHGQFRLLSSLLLLQRAVRYRHRRRQRQAHAGNAGAEIRPFKRLRSSSRSPRTATTRPASARSPSRSCSRRARPIPRWLRR
jgi:predicted CXXCH cytochrome family protein